GRELEEERTRRLAVVVDAVRDDAPGPDGLTTLDRACSGAASVAAAASADGHGTRLVTAPDGQPRVLARVDLADLLVHLGRLEPTQGRPLAAVLDDAGDELRGIETAVIVFAPWPENAATSVVPAI